MYSIPDNLQIIFVYIRGYSKKESHMADYSKIITENIRKYRILRGLTQESMANKLMVDVQYYSQLERGKRNFTIDRIIDSCKILNVNIEDIICIKPVLEDDTSEIISRIDEKIADASYKQLMLIERFIDDISDLV